MKKTFLLIIAIVSIAGCKTNTSKNDSLSLILQPKSGSSAAGAANFTENNGRVTFSAAITGLKPGVHAIHIHEKSDCSSADATSAGGHWNPTFKAHGKWGTGEYHRGDIGNFTVNEDGRGAITMTTDEWCIGCGDPAKDILGKSIIVHEKADDFTTQPTGNAGGRMACSAIIR